MKFPLTTSYYKNKSFRHYVENVFSAKIIISEMKQVMFF